VRTVRLDDMQETWFMVVRLLQIAHEESAAHLSGGNHKEMAYQLQQ
jgi:hypothetical protein